MEPFKQRDESPSQDGEPVRVPVVRRVPVVGKSTLDIAERLIREAGSPLSVREIVERAGLALKTQSATPRNTVHRDLALEIKRNGDRSRFIRPSRGRYALRAEA